MPANDQHREPVSSTLLPWLSMYGAERAILFYKEAFGAREVYRLEGDGVVVRLSVDGAEFWLSEDSNGATPPQPAASIRFILTVPDPDTVFAQALRAGAIEVYPVGEAHGWRVGRLMDPFGLHWEIGRQLSE